MKYLNVSGFVFSGKSAVYDLLSGFEGVAGGDYHEEFDLIRVPGGLSDLANSFDNWTYMGVSDAIQRFCKVAKRLGDEPRGIKRLIDIGWAYERRYPGFQAATNHFIEQLCVLSLETEWPYAELEGNSRQLLTRKIKDRVPFVKRKPVKVVSAYQSDFYDACSRYLEQVFNSTLDLKDFIGKPSWILFTNALDATNPHAGLRLSDKLYSITVDRDVRDIFYDSVMESTGFNDNVNLYTKMTGADNISLFIERQKLMRQKLTSGSDSSRSRFLTIRFEDLVLHRKRIETELSSFLDLEPPSNNSFSSFDESISRVNVGRWKTLSPTYNAAIRSLEEALPDLCTQA